MEFTDYLNEILSVQQEKSIVRKVVMYGKHQSCKINAHMHWI